MDKKNWAFIFDMDGVLVNSEEMWVKYGYSFLRSLYGEIVFEKLGDLIGLSVDKEYELATSFGFKMDKEAYLKAYDKQAILIYSKCTISAGLNNLLQKLKGMDFKIGLVSASRESWVKQVLSRVSLNDAFDYVLSLNDRKDLRPKPYPDGYIKAMNGLNALPENTIILEDSNLGIQAAKAAGAYTITYTEHLLPGYVQIEADAKAKDMEEVMKVIDER